MSVHRRRARLCWTLLVAGLAASSAAGDVAVEQIRVPTHRGMEVFLVEAPGAARSAARRVNLDLVGKDGVAPEPTAGYEVTSTVIVRAGEGWAGRAGAAAFESLPGYWKVEAGSVREAAALAVALRGEAGVIEAYVDMRVPQPLRTLPDDPNVPQQWHLSNGVLPGVDLNVAPVWKEGYTGAGITIGIIEDGWHVTHPDLAANFHNAASQAGTGTTNHGTSVAGCAAAAGGNGIGGVGSAYGARVSKLYRGTSAANAAAFMYRNDLNHVKNNSWGPIDNATAWVMASVERDALAQAVISGRGGLGTIHIWAAGNGGDRQDRVDYDPYASSRYTIAVGAIDDDDDRSYYSEPGSSVLVVAPSSGTPGVNRGVVTTSGPSGYTTGFGGTSAAAPLAAGVVALMLEARPELTWRDVQHVLIESARRCDPGSAGWEMNGAGRWVSYDYGFGAVDAAAAVELAQTWALVGPEVMVETPEQVVGAAIPDADAAGVERTIVVEEAVRLEAVEVELTALHPFIGDLRIELTAPSGTGSVFALPRADPQDDYVGYVFTSVRHWGESSAGAWTLRIADERAGDVGTWVSWRLRLYGTEMAGGCVADRDGDGQVNSNDISAFLSQWLTSVQEGTLEGDFDGDGAVNSNDISAFLAAWLAEVGGGC